MLLALPQRALRPLPVAHRRDHQEDGHGGHHHKSNRAHEACCIAAGGNDEELERKDEKVAASRPRPRRRPAAALPRRLSRGKTWGKRYEKTHVNTRRGARPYGPAHFL